MEIKEKNETIDFELIEKENCILNSLIISILLYNDLQSNRLAAQLILKPQTIKFKGQIQFNFFNVNMFYWYNKDDFSLGYVERYNFIRLENGLYLSLDPFDEYSKTCCDQDNNVIWAKRVERTIVEADSM